MDMDRFLNWQNIERYKTLSNIATDETQRRLILGHLAEELKKSKKIACSRYVLIAAIVMGI